VSLYTLGEVATLTLNTYNSAGAAADAGSVALKITAPDGTVTNVALGSLTHVASSGVYSYLFTPTMLGRYRVEWIATGANATDSVGSFAVYGATIATPADLRARYVGGGAADLTDSTRYPDWLLRIALEGAAEQWASSANVRVAPWSESITWIGDGTGIAKFPIVKVSSVSALTVNGTTIAGSNYLVSRAGIIQLTTGVFTAAKTCTAMVTHGLDYPPRTVVDAIMERATELVLGSNVPARTIAQGGDLGYTRFSLAGRDGSSGIAAFDSSASLFGAAIGFA